MVAAHDQGKALIADTAYDSDEIIAQVRAQQMKPVICPHPRRNIRPPLDRKKYRKRYRVEVFFHDIKRLRAIATRFEKRAVHYLSFNSSQRCSGFRHLTLWSHEKRLKHPLRCGDEIGQLFGGFIR